MAHLSDDQLHNQLEAKICDKLTVPVLRVRLADILTLKEWIKEVKHLNNKCLKDFAFHRKIAEELYKKHTTSSKPSSSKTYNPSSSAYNSSSSCLRALTESKHTLLMKHKGCFKCRKFYVSHQLKECPDGAPEASSYKMLTESDTIAAKLKMKSVVAIGPVGAVMPSSVLNSRSDSEDDMCVAPFETAHLIWPCLLTGPSSTLFEHVHPKFWITDPIRSNPQICSISIIISFFIHILFI
jgi:hypothetical protein